MIGKEANHPSPEGLDCLPLAREPTTLPTRVKSLSRHKPPSTPTAKRQNKKPKSNIMFDLGFSWRRLRDSNPRGFGPNGFQDRLVVTASISLHIYGVAYYTIYAA